MPRGTGKLTGRTFFGRYRLKQRMGGGAFGEVYVGVDKHSPDEGTLVAVKVESTSSENFFLYREMLMYKALCNTDYFPRWYYYGTESGYNVLVMELMSSDLEDQLRLCCGTFSEKTCCMLAISVIKALRVIHERGYVHCDIKPDNLMVGLDETKKDRVAIVDFGLSHRRRSEEDPNRRGKGLNGTCRYASRNAHLGFTPSSCDDLESLGYVLIYFMRGRLPWQGFVGMTKEEKEARVWENKESITAARLCNGLHPVFADYLTNVRHMNYYSVVDYDSLIAKFHEALLQMNDPADLKFDWFINGTVRSKRALIMNEEDARAPAAAEPPMKKARVEPPPREEAPALPIAQERNDRNVGLVPNWILVTTASETPGEEFLVTDLSYTSLVTKVRDLWNGKDRYRITLVTANACKWIAIMRTNTAYDIQSMKRSTSFFPQEWIHKKWREGFFITGMVGNGVSSVVVMSTGTGFTQQCIKVSSQFPREWIAERWNSGYFITLVTSSDNLWGVIMSRGVDIEQQALEIHSAYPSPQVHARWDTGYRITSVARVREMIAVVMSRYKNESSLPHQVCRRSGSFPQAFITQEVARGRTVTAMCSHSSVWT